MCDVVFGIFILTWLVARQVIFPMTIWSFYHDSPQLIPSGCYRGTAEQLQGPFAVPNDWFHLLDPFVDPAGTVCMNDGIRNGFLLFLLVLQVMMFVWLYSIVKVAMRVIRGHGAEDVRSDGEAEEEAGDEEAWHCVEDRRLEMEVGVEGFDLKAWEGHRNSGKGCVSSTGVTMPLSEAKAVLNRVGCEKKIEC